MAQPDFTRTYRRLTAKLLEDSDLDRAMSDAVGGEFMAAGSLEYALLRQLGLEPNHTVIDVGCGSGRLAFQLREFLVGPYIGLDVVPELFDYARQVCARPDWRFYEAPGLSIPETSDLADFVCFFSVMTHLTHADAYRYLAEAGRVLKPGGRIVISFLEFAIAAHWPAFEQVLADEHQEGVLNQFTERVALEAWATDLGLSIEMFMDGDEPTIELETPVQWENGQIMTDRGNLGQSICVMGKP